VEALALQRGPQLWDGASMCGVHGGRKREKITDGSAPLQSVRIKIRSLIVGDSLDRGVVKRGWPREVRRGGSKCQ
jgi:hypothetical protein